MLRCVMLRFVAVLCYDVLCCVLSQCYVAFRRSIGYGVGVRGECGSRRCKEKSIMKV